MKDQYGYQSRGAHQEMNCSVRSLHWRIWPHLCSERAVAITKRRGINIVAPHSNVCNARLSQILSIYKKKSKTKFCHNFFCHIFICWLRWPQNFLVKNVWTRWSARSSYQRSKDIKKKDAGYKTVEHNFAGFPSKCPQGPCFVSVFALYDRSKLGVGQSLIVLSPACNPPPLALADAAEHFLGFKWWPEKLSSDHFGLYLSIGHCGVKDVTVST